MRFINFLSIGVLLIYSSLMLTGCGFHLRKPIHLPDSMHSIYVKSSNASNSFIPILKNLLKANGIELVNTPTQADAVLNITNIITNSQLSALSGSANAGEYELSLQINFNVKDHQGNYLIRPRFVRALASYTSNSTQILSSESQVAALTNGLQHSLAQQILTQLSALPN